MYEFQEIVLATEPEAKAVLDNLRKLIDRYERVSMSEFLELVGISSSFIDTKVGWVDLTNVSIKPTLDGYFLDLPKPQHFNRPIGTFPFLKGWWIVVEVPDEQTYEGKLVDEMGGNMILETARNTRFGISMKSINKIDAYKERPK